LTDQGGRIHSKHSSDLSPRLQAVAGLVTDGYRLADIGTDHAYVPIWLVKTGRIPGAVAADINKSPLQRAAEHISASGLDSQIETRLSDGFSALSPGEVQSAVLAGMGGGLMIRILKEGSRVVECLEECILQPQSEIEKVRAFLLEEGFLFLEEDMVADDGKYYPMMKVKPWRGKPETEKEKNGSEKGGNQIWTEEESCPAGVFRKRKMHQTTDTFASGNRRFRQNQGKKENGERGTELYRERTELLCCAKRLYR